MTRALFAGWTNYSSQTLEEMIVDLKNWINNFDDSRSNLINEIHLLKNRGYWENVDVDFQTLMAEAIDVFDRSSKEITAILIEFNVEIKASHVARLQRLYEVGKDLDKNIVTNWKHDYDHSKKEYGTENFKIVERMYHDSREMAIDMLDLSNLVVRLKDFVGHKSAIPTKAESSSEDILEIKPSYGPFTVNLNALYRKIVKFFKR